MTLPDHHAGSRESPTPAGLLLVDKPTGPTSMDVCARVRWKLRQAGAPKRIKVGHGGTLDPMATGLLVVMVGKATKLCDSVMAGEKEYEATIDLSHRSTTDDAEGELTRVAMSAAPTREAVVAGLAQFVGQIMQVPPQFSALHVGGQRAYDLAREGKAVTLAARPVTVHGIDVLGYEFPSVRVRIACGKGTYIRSIARDLGSVLGTGGMLTALRRTQVGRWHVRDATAMDALAGMLTQADLIAI
jgi:tRNA pseudouridine55 synthase